MKTVVIVVLMAVIAYLLVADKVHWRPRPSGTHSNPIPRVRDAPRVRVATDLPPPEVHASKAMFMRGMVAAIEGDHATVDCEYAAQLSPEALDKWNRAFGDLQSVDASGQFVPAQLHPPNRVRGQAVLMGAPVAQGETVNVVVVPAGTDVYTARFKLGSGTWMYDRSSGANSGPLNRRPYHRTF